MIRKLIVLSLLTLGIGFASSTPASAILQCDCELCFSNPGVKCSWGVVMKCSSFYSQYCPPN